MTKTTRRKVLKAGTGLAASTELTGLTVNAATMGSRTTISLDGIWEVADSVNATDRPATYDRRAPVPGLTHSALPPFPDVDRFDSAERELMRQLIQLPFNEEVIKAGGIARQQRNYFWYRTYFTAPERHHAAATLKVNKAQFGSAVWINGIELGSEESCFTATTYDIAKTVRWGERNELIIRIGAHPKVLSPGNVCNTDFEKADWTPGIWDSVSVWFDDGPSIVRQQVAPRIATSEIIVQTVLRNVSATPVTFQLTHSVTGLRDLKSLAGAQSTISLAGNEERTITERIAFKKAALWSPESPTLYRLHTSTSGDETVTRFGMREFRFDTATKRAYLNGKMIFLRGSNIVLHRFFEDPLSEMLPWNEQWLRKLLGENPQKMHWNMLKFCISPVPQIWLDIADEVGLLVLYEFPVWVLSSDIMPTYAKTYDPQLLRREYERWLSDSWNHPSIVYWNASEESSLPPELSSDMIAAIRKLDLSDRAWGNGWSAPEGPDDPVEDHLYEFNNPGFDMTLLEGRGGSARTSMVAPSGHPVILTEYAWLWVNRDGSVPIFDQAVYSALPYPHATAEERFETLAYLVAGLTEYWRAYRNLAGVLHFTYLGASTTESWTSDNLADVQALEFNSHFLTYVRDAFKPLGVYVNFWQRQLAPAAVRSFDVMMINDEAETNTGNLSLRLESADGDVLAEASKSYLITGYGQSTYKMTIKLPEYEGHCRLVAQAAPVGRGNQEPTISRRWVELTKRPPAKAPDGTHAEVKEGQF